MASAGVRLGVSTTKSSSFTFVVGTVVVGVIVAVGALIGIFGVVFITLAGKVVVGFAGVVTVLIGVGVAFGALIGVLGMLTGFETVGITLVVIFFVALVGVVG